MEKALLAAALVPVGPYFSFQELGALPSAPPPLAQHLSIVWPTLLGRKELVQIGCSLFDFGVEELATWVA